MVRLLTVSMCVPIANTPALVDVPMVTMSPAVLGSAASAPSASVPISIFVGPV
jgi:hypothetical protein